ncbi:hypothetical protein DEO72_LG2g2022 [Vigna unguiculata]|uniref:Uncharacterized protein n=1 Tax=Vigna unguiculata TaxID=3917 RepID=A0A4D6KW56_VIGUN|nr:hypothetical protein DEO72_LG2g2022 [Vigna unguiculata]
MLTKYKNIMRMLKARLGYSGTEAYKEAVTFLQFCPTILPRVSKNQCSKETLGLSYKRTEAYKAAQ